jgi:putative tricarboxylic transport membrane protein
MKRLTSLLIILAMMVLAACSQGDSSVKVSADGTWEPDKTIEIVAPSGAGGGWDTTARMAAKVFEETGIIDENIGVVNKPGGGGAVGWSYIAKKNGSPYNLFVNSPPMVLIPLNGLSPYDHEDFTPISNVIADYGAFAVSADAKWDNLNELFDDMKKDPSSVTVIGASTPGSMDHIQFVKIAKAAGVDVTKIRYVTDQDGGALTALLNGSVDVYSAGIAETVEQVKAGKVKVLGITSEERLEGEIISEFPTAKEQGIDATFVNWRGFFGPADMHPAVVDYYEKKFKELSDSPEFAKIREQYGWDELYMNSEEYKQFLNDEKEDIKGLLDEMGLIR